MKNPLNQIRASQIPARVLAKEQLDLIERFKVAYNGIDHFLRKFLQRDQDVSFRQLVKEYAARYPRWRYQESLLLLSELRNMLVHLPEKEYAYISIPTDIAIETIESIRDGFLAPELVLPKYQKPVTTIARSDSLTAVLEIINKEEFSQFPVYNDGKFVGLLSENGITRWLAQHTVNKLTLVEFNEERVEAVLLHEEKRNNVEFINRFTTLMDAENRFVFNPLLEALLISEHAKPEDALLGIITRWDLLRLTS